MRTVAVFLISIFCIATALAATSGQQGFPLGLPKCKGTALKISQSMNTTIQGCFKKFQPDAKKDMTDSAKCLVVCSGQGLGILDSSGKLLTSKVGPFLKSVFPATVVDSISKTITTCATEKGANAVVSESDKKCENFKAMFDCILEGGKKACAP